MRVFTYRTEVKRHVSCDPMCRDNNSNNNNNSDDNNAQS